MSPLRILLAALVSTVAMGGVMAGTATAIKPTLSILGNSEVGGTLRVGLAGGKAISTHWQRCAYRNCGSPRVVSRATRYKIKSSDARAYFRIKAVVTQKRGKRTVRMTMLSSWTGPIPVPLPTSGRPSTGSSSSGNQGANTATTASGPGRAFATPYPFGTPQKITSRGSSGAVSDVNTVTVTGYTANANAIIAQWGSPNPGKRVTRVRLRVTNDSATPRSIPTSYMALVASSLTGVSAYLTGVPDPEHFITSCPLYAPAGGACEGWLYFEVPTGTTTDPAALRLGVAFTFVAGNDYLFALA